MDAITEVLGDISGVIWGKYVLIPLLLGTGLYLTFRLGGLQFTKLGAAMRLGILRRKDAESEGDISQFQALTTALAATVGTGNIVGVATAISIAIIAASFISGNTTEASAGNYVPASWHVPQSDFFTGYSKASDE